MILVDLRACTRKNGDRLGHLIINNNPRPVDRISFVWEGENDTRNEEHINEHNEVAVCDVGW